MNEELEVCEIVNGPRYIQSIYDLGGKGSLYMYDNNMLLRREFRFRGDLLGWASTEEMFTYADWRENGKKDPGYEEVEISHD